MLTDNDIIFNYTGTQGVALGWILDETCVYSVPLSVEHAEIFINSDEVLDISEDYTDHDGITVRFIKNGEVVEDFQTTEYFGSILLSEPLVLSLLDTPYGYCVNNDNAAKWDGEKFYFLNRDVSGLSPWNLKYKPADPNHPIYKWIEENN